ncbi:MAG: DedA family protein [Methanosarcinaceae archaeon]|nr:DedA family protein [Methanosarcinaceae archaeon]MDD4331518.1 DedA family protein [Methanosarcinaceae archaeon]
MLELLLSILTSHLARYGYLNLFIFSFLAATILPLGSEPLMVALLYQGFNPFAVVIVATIGNFLGSCTTYYLGLKGRAVLEKYLYASEKSLKKGEELFNKYGIYALLFTWVPGIGDGITMMAGLMNLSFKVFSVLVFIGKFSRYFVLAYFIEYLNFIL